MIPAHTHKVFFTDLCDCYCGYDYSQRDVCVNSTACHAYQLTTFSFSTKGFTVNTLYTLFHLSNTPNACIYSGTSNKGPSDIGTTSLKG